VTVNRRELLVGMGGVAAAAALAPLGGRTLEGADQSSSPAAGVSLPRKSDFAILPGHTYLNSAYIHPMPLGAVGAVRRNAESLSQAGEQSKQGDVKAEFAALINAKPSEISFVPNTSAGENLVVQGLGIARNEGNVVTDALHFEGALIHLYELQRRGLDLRVVMPRAWRIELSDLEKVVDRKTRLIEVSLVAMYNGFQHDLKAVCDLAHAHGAYVYADIAQAAGCVPIDVRASGVDFCACSSFKWLMGDFSFGFLFAREELLERVVQRTQYGYYATSALATHFLPYDPPGNALYTWTLRPDAAGHFEVGSNGGSGRAALEYSLPYLRRLGVGNIQAHRQPLLKRLHAEMPRLGFEPVTPEDSTSALITFAVKDPVPVKERLTRANVNARLGQHFIRISPSIFNDLGDVDRLLEALSAS
jgi:selenocysteine lyase/cysteine desulfurase